MASDRIKLRQTIVEKHAQALLDELDRRGFEPVGVGGSIVLRRMEPGERVSGGGPGNPAHVFVLVQPGVTSEDGRPLDGQAFLTDCARTMVGPSPLDRIPDDGEN